MTPRDFVYWLQGLAELSTTTGLSPKQWNIVKQHLSLVMTNVTVTEALPMTSVEFDNTLFHKLEDELKQTPPVLTC